MHRFIWAFAFTFMIAAQALAAPPRTLAYQGRLADGGGQPINGTLSITFRIYDVADGGTALWTETLPAVDVDAGNLAVELGAGVPLPADVWGRQLWLGVQVAGDSEMLPRPPLTAAPFALRAAATMRGTVVVSAEGSASENGAALLAAVAALGTPTAAQPRTVELDSGVFDLGNARLDLPSYVTLVGRGEGATLITSSSGVGTVLLASHSHVRQLTGRNTGTPPTDFDATFGIGAAGPNGERVEEVSLQHVTGEAIGVPGDLGARQGLYLCTRNSVVRESTGRGFGGSFSFGMRSDCGNPHDSSGLRIEGLTLHSSGGNEGVRGVYLSGGGQWHGMDIRVETNNDAMTTYGLRVWPGEGSAAGEPLEVADLSVYISGGDLLAPTASVLVEAVRLESGVGASFRQVGVEIDRVKAEYASGIRHYGHDTNVSKVRWSDLDVSVTALTTDPDVQFAWAHGIRLHGASPEVHRARVRVSCMAGSAQGCTGIARDSSTGSLQPGALLLDQVSVEAGHVDPALASNAQSKGYSGEGPARIVDSTLRVFVSPAGEWHVALEPQGADPAVRVLDSRIEVVSAAPPGNGCVVGGPGANLELFESYFQGFQFTGCIGGTPTCAGNTVHGAGFLAGTCP